MNDVFSYYNEKSEKAWTERINIMSTQELIDQVWQKIELDPEFMKTNLASIEKMVNLIEIGDVDLAGEEARKLLSK